MAKPPKKPKVEEVETEPDAWERFTTAIARMIPPKRKPKSKTKDAEK